MHCCLPIRFAASSIHLERGSLCIGWITKKSLRRAHAIKGIEAPGPKRLGVLSFYASGNDHVDKQGQVSVFPLVWDPFEDPYGLALDMQPRNPAIQSPEPRSWYGPDGQLVRELPCPSCRGRGYVLCPRCDVGNPEVSCPECLGKGLRTCPQCLGECVVWEESLDEMPWEKAKSRSPLQVADDDVIDSMEIQLAPERKSKRVYSSHTAEVRAKISHALKMLDARTGSVTRRLRRIHNDPILNAKRIAAIKKAKRTEAARRHMAEKQRSYFQNPENRLKRSLRMKGLKGDFVSKGSRFY